MHMFLVHGILRATTYNYKYQPGSSDLILATVRFSVAARRFSTGAATLKQAAAATAFTEWHASDLSARLKGKCSEPTTTNAALLRTADAFTLQHAELHTCHVGQVIAEQTRKTFLSPVGQLHFEWACCHSMMPMELPLRWHCRLLLRRAADWRPDSTAKTS